jgi:membrane-bound lytic murein transglycosylase B
MFLKRHRAIRIFSSIGLVIVALVVFPLTVSATTEKRPWLFSSLKKKLVADGFDKGKIHHIYTSPNITFSDKTISRYFIYREGKLNYKQFTSQKAIKNTLEYMENHKDELARAEDRFSVEKEVITAIILVETRLGTYLGNSNVLNMLSTMAALHNHANRDLLWRERLNNQKISRKKYDRKALRKAKWAYGELKAFLSYTTNYDTDPSKVMGSFAGAIGIAQFMPSNILLLGEDGDGDGSVDLFTHADAIASIANYLKHHGWQPGMDRKKSYKVVYRYNHSKYYVNTVLEIADLLRGG